MEKDDLSRLEVLRQWHRSGIPISPAFEVVRSDVGFLLQIVDDLQQMLKTAEGELDVAAAQIHDLRDEKGIETIRQQAWLAGYDTARNEFHGFR